MDSSSLIKKEEMVIILTIKERDEKFASLKSTKFYLRLCLLTLVTVVNLMLLGISLTTEKFSHLCGSLGILLFVVAILFAGIAFVCLEGELINSIKSRWYGKEKEIPISEVEPHLPPCKVVIT